VKIGKKNSRRIQAFFSLLVSALVATMISKIQDGPNISRFQSLIN
jgi:hypothetical protein